jgi:hypothetical protein
MRRTPVTALNKQVNVLQAALSATSDALMRLLGQDWSY